MLLGRKTISPRPKGDLWVKEGRKRDSDASKVVAVVVENEREVEKKGDEQAEVKERLS